MTADKRRIDACLKACEGISTKNLEDNVPVLELARRYNVVLRERDALRAKIKATGEQEPVAQVGVHKTGGNAGIAWSARPLNEFDSLPPLCDGDKLYLAPGAQPAPSALAEAIIADMQAQHDSELITENDSGEALIRLDGAIAAVEDNFALAYPTPSLASNEVSLMDEGTPSMSDSLPVYADPFTYVIQHLNSNPYSLTKDECVTLIKELRDLYNAAPEAKP